MIARESITHQEKALCTQQPGHGETCCGQLIHERRRADRKREIEFLDQCELQALKIEEEATQEVRDMDIQTKAMLEEQSSGLINQADYELNLQENKAANAVQNLEQQLRQQYMELSSGRRDCEASRNGQLHLLAELRDREYAHQETLIRRSEEMEELRKVRFSESELA